MVGTLHDQDDPGKWRFVPYCCIINTRSLQEMCCALTVVQPARMFPSHQKLLYMPAIVPR